MLDAGGRIDCVNDRGAAMLGYRPEELLGRSSTEMGLPDLGTGDRKVNVMASVHRGDDKQAWLSFNVAPRFDGVRRDGIIATFHDVSEPKRLEETLSLVEARFRSLFQNPHEAVALLSYVLDERGEIIDAVLVDVNGLFVKTIGRPREHIVGRTLVEVLGADTVTDHLSILKSMSSKNEPVTFEAYLGPLDVYVRNLLTPVSAELFILSSLDMTKATRARHQSEESAEIARRHSEELAALMDAVPSAVWIAHDPQCGVITGNKAAARLYESGEDENVSAGTSAGKELNRARQFFKNGVELRPENLPMQLAVATGTEIHDYEIDVQVPSGKRKTMLGDAIPLFDSEGRVRGSVASFIDITERKRSDNDIAFQAHLLASVHDAIIALDSNFRITYWNDVAEQMFGWTGQEALGKDSGELLRTKVTDFMHEDVTGPALEDDRYDSDAIYYHKDGHEIYVAAHLRVVRGQDGGIKDIVASFRDITGRKRVERELQEYSRGLERSNDELQQFAYIASHDLKEPLRMVTMYMDILDKKYGSELSPQAKEYMGIARQGAERLRQLVSDILQYSRIETRRNDFSKVEMDQIARTVMDDLALAISEAGASVSIDPLPAILADEMQMKLVLTNLITNAIKFRGIDPPMVEVTASTLSDVCVFSVKDNGIGIDPRYQDKLFKMFQRLHAQEEYPGTGIGLAISKKIVERHGGWIWVDSDGKSGSTFYFTIPRCGEESDNRAGL